MMEPIKDHNEEDILPNEVSPINPSEATEVPKKTLDAILKGHEEIKKVIKDLVGWL